MTDPAVASLLGAGPQPPAPTPTPPATSPAPTPAPPQPPPSPAPAPSPQPSPGTQPTDEDQRVPYSRFTEVNDKLKAAQAEAAELKAWKEQQEQAQLSEIEKAQRAAEQATQRATEAEARALTRERTQWVVAAATAAGFADPADAALAVDLSKLTDKDAATAAVTQLATEKPHWLGQAQPARPQGFGTIAGQPGSQAQVPVGPDGKPDEKAGLGRELMNNLFGTR